MALLCIGSGRSTMPFGSFWHAKRAVLQCDMGRIATGLMAVFMPVFVAFG